MTEFRFPNYSKCLDITLSSLEIEEPCNYLEIGIWEGRGACLVLDKYLKHKRSRYTGIEKYPQPHMWSNLGKHRDRSTVVLGDSFTTLSLFNKDIFDIVYIDGSHDYQDVLYDSMLSYKTVKDEGIMIWDDYNTDKFGVKKAVNDFLYGRNYKVLFKGWQLAIRVKK